jgi:hypothetical protein
MKFQKKKKKKKLGGQLMSAWASGAIDRISEHANLCVCCCQLFRSVGKDMSKCRGGEGEG